jgi:hypothetical protein
LTKRPPLSWSASRSASIWRPLRLPLALLALVLLGPAAYQLRRQFIQRFFIDAPPGPAPALTAAPAGSPGIGAVSRLRVMLIDGLDLPTARRLPGLQRLCAAGADLQVDVGFPTVSLPVQSVLWTGLTQQQSGLWYRVAGLPRSLPHAAPARLPGSAAIAEEQAFIAGSFGFDRLWPGTGSFEQAAADEAAAPSPLVFVHVLRVDKAGHRQGAASAPYRQAAVEADALLDRLLALTPPAADLRWLVLSDHGQRPRGGHGGAEPAIRIVRACLAGGPQPLPAAGIEPIQLVDLSRALFDSLALPPVPGAVGRPLAFAIGHPDRGGTLPGQRPGRIVPALLMVAVVVLLVAMAWIRVRPLWLPAVWTAWLPLAWLSMVIGHGWPTLSNPAVYPPQGRDMILAALPGVLVLLLATGWGVRRGRSPLFLASAPAALLAAITLSALLACGGVAALLGSQHPPLDPHTTGPASFLLAVSASTCPGLALAALAGLAASRWWPAPAAGGPPIAGPSSAAPD